VSIVFIWLLIINHATRALFLEYVFIFVVMIFLFPKFVIKIIVTMLSAICLAAILYYFFILNQQTQVTNSHIFIILAIVFVALMSIASFLLIKFQILSIKKLIYGYLGVFIIAAIYILFFYIDWHGGVFTKIIHNGSNLADRLHRWTFAFNTALDEPLLGVGKMNLYMYSNDINDVRPHRIIFEVMADYGFIALFSFIVLIVTGFFNFFKKALKSKQDLLFFIVSCSALAGFVHSLFSGIYRVNMGRYSLIIAVALFLSTFLGDEKRHKLLKSEDTSFFVGLIVLFFVTVLVASIDLHWTVAV